MPTYVLSNPSGRLLFQLVPEAEYEKTVAQLRLMSGDTLSDHRAHFVQLKAGQTVILRTEAPGPRAV